MTRTEFAALLRDPAAFAAALADDPLVALFASMRSAMADPAWPLDDPATDRRVTDGLAAELDRRGLLGEAELFFVANRTEVEAAARTGRR